MAAADTVAAAPASASEPTSESAEDRAAAAFERALKQHAAGDLQGARASMLESYRLSARAELLYNIGKIHAALGECPLALAAYRDYLKQVPDGRYRVEALQASGQLEAQCPPADASAVADAPPAPSATVVAPLAAPAVTTEAQQPAGAESAQPQQDAVTPASNRAATVRWIGWSAIGAGALAGVGAVYFTAQAYDARSRFKDSVDAAARANNGALIDAGIQDQQHAHQRWAKILGVTGCALVAGGTLTLIFGPKRPLPAGARLELQVLPGSVGASYAATF